MGRENQREVAPVTPAQKHDRSRYNKGCRCDVCREANNDYSRARFAAWRAANPLPPKPPEVFAAPLAIVKVHGRVGYLKHRCRCRTCLVAHRKYNREWERRRKAETEDFTPPRAPEVVVEPCFKPTPPRPVRAVVRETPPPAPIAAPPQSEATGTQRVGSCHAVCALTGWPCLLPAHEGAHRHRRGAFALVAAPGQRLFGEREVDRYAFASTIDAGMGEVRKGYAAEKQASRDRLASGVRLRRAHNGHPTTAGNNEKAADLRRST